MLNNIKKHGIKLFDVSLRDGLQSMPKILSKRLSNRLRKYSFSLFPKSLLFSIWLISLDALNISLKSIRFWPI